MFTLTKFFYENIFKIPCDCESLLALATLGDATLTKMILFVSRCTRYVGVVLKQGIANVFTKRRQCKRPLKAFSLLQNIKITYILLEFSDALPLRFIQKLLSSLKTWWCQQTSSDERDREREGVRKVRKRKREIERDRESRGVSNRAKQTRKK